MFFVHWMQSPVDADPLPQGVSLKSMIRNFRKEARHLKKKLKKIKDELQRSRKNASEAMIEVTYLWKLHRKDSTSFSIWKDNFKRKLVKLKKSVSDNS